jgi:dethiobiotin synthetase
MPTVFITATGTDIGKTYLACALIRRLRLLGQSVDALKPVASGFDPARPAGSDAGLLLQALGKPVTNEEIARISPWRFAASLSPDLAARREGHTLDFDAVVDFSRKAGQADCGTLLIEGIGGVMVPLDGRHTVLDWMAALQAPALLVAGSYLGTLSHTLTCLEVLRHRDIALRAVIVNESADSTVSLDDTIASLSQYTRRIPVITIRRNDAESLESTLSRIIALIA